MPERKSGGWRFRQCISSLKRSPLVPGANNPMPFQPTSRFVQTLPAIGFAILTAGATPASSHAAPCGPREMEISDARHEPLGTSVTVQGAVTVPSGTFSSFTSDQGFAIQDRTGGIYVSVPDDLNLELRQIVRVTGELTDSFGLLVLTKARVDLQDGQRKVKPEAVPTGDVNESTEGRLIEIVGTITQPLENDEPFGYRLFVDDGSGEIQVFIAVSAGVDVLDLPFLTPGQRVRATGFSGQYVNPSDDPPQNHYEIDSRSRADIEPVDR